MFEFQNSPKDKVLEKCSTVLITSSLVLNTPLLEVVNSLSFKIFPSNAASKIPNNIAKNHPFAFFTSNATLSVTYL